MKKNTYSPPYTSTQIYNTVRSMMAESTPYADIRAIMYMAYFTHIQSTGKKLFNDIILTTGHGKAVANPQSIHFKNPLVNDIRIEKLDKIYDYYEKNKIELESFKNKKIIPINDSILKLQYRLAIAFLVGVSLIPFVPFLIALQMFGVNISNITNFFHVVNKPPKNIFKSNQLMVHPRDTETIELLEESIKSFADKYTFCHNTFYEPMNIAYIMDGEYSEIKDEYFISAMVR
ncbi:hypothetical protein [Microcystis phage Mel-JY01]